jgi:hypothetical protein
MVPALAAAMLSTSACGGDDPTGNSGDALTPLEAQALVSAFFVALQGIDIPLLNTGGPAAVPYGDVYDDVIAGQDECFGGGSTSISGLITGDVDQQAGTAVLSAEADVDFINCVVPTETVAFTLNGAPDVHLSADIDISETAITIDIAMEGDVAFVGSDGRSGTCAIDLSVAAGASSSGVNQTLLGSACGTSASNFDVVLFD